jgi:hypothetical protein
MLRTIRLSLAGRGPHGCGRGHRPGSQDRSDQPVFRAARALRRRAHRGFELAVDQVNAAGGLLGKKVAIVRGSATTAQEGIAAVEQLVGRDKVDLLIGPYVSAISNAASESALNNGKLYWETNALARDLTERGLPNFIRSGPGGDDFARRSVEGVLNLVPRSSASSRRTSRSGSSTRIRSSAPRS